MSDPAHSEETLSKTSATSLSSLGASVMRPIRSLLKREELSILAALLLLGFVLSVSTPYFFTAHNLFQIGRQVAYIGILATGMCFVLASGQIDISVGSIVTLSSWAIAVAMTKGVNPWLAMLLGWGTGILCGLVNGGLILSLGVHPMIITLGTTSVYRGLAIVLSSGRPISKFARDSSFFFIGHGKLGPIPVPFIILVTLAILGHVVIRRTVFGRHVCAVGSNLAAARYAGIRTGLVRLQAMVLMGLLAGIAGSVTVAHLECFDPLIGTGFEMDAIGAAVIGGTSLFGGSATVIGALIGTAIIGVLRNGLVHLGVGAYWNPVVTGIIIIGAVAVGSLVKRGRRG